MTRGEIRRMVEAASVERVREILDRLQALKMHHPIGDEKEKAFLLDLRDHEAFFRELADAKLQGQG